MGSRQECPVLLSALRYLTSQSWTAQSFYSPWFQWSLHRTDTGAPTLQVTQQEGEGTLGMWHWPDKYRRWAGTQHRTLKGGGALESVKLRAHWIPASTPVLPVRLWSQDSMYTILTGTSLHIRSGKGSRQRRLELLRSLQTPSQLLLLLKLLQLLLQRRKK